MERRKLNFFLDIEWEKIYESGTAASCGAANPIPAAVTQKILNMNLFQCRSKNKGEHW